MTFRGKAILVVHDLAIYLHPEWFPEKQWFSTKILVPLSLRKASLIVTVSLNTKNDLLKLFNLNEEKIRALEQELIDTHSAYRKADYALRKGFNFQIESLKKELIKLNEEVKKNDKPNGNSKGL